MISTDQLRDFNLQTTSVLAQANIVEGTYARVVEPSVKPINQPKPA